MEHELQKLEVQFNITFVGEYNTEVRSVVPQNFEENIFYNCGDETFEYVIQNYYNGPFFKVQLVEEQRRNIEYCGNGSCFFQFNNYQMSTVF